MSSTPESASSLNFIEQIIEDDNCTGKFAGRVHKDFEAGLKSARVWGTGVFDGQTVGRDHVLHDKDVVELHL